MMIASVKIFLDERFAADYKSNTDNRWKPKIVEPETENDYVHDFDYVTAARIQRPRPRLRLHPLRPDDRGLDPEDP